MSTDLIVKKINLYYLMTTKVVKLNLVTFTMVSTSQERKMGEGCHFSSSNPVLPALSAVNAV